MKKVSVQKRNHVILFADIHHFSVIMYTLDKAYPDFIQDVYETLGEIMVDHGGEIIKYFADSILTIFPGDHEKEAVRCALELRQAFPRILERFNVTVESELETGIASGEISRGVFGHSSLQMKDIFGVKVNEAGLIGHHRGIAITRDVYEKIKDTFETRKLQGRKVRWLEEPLEVWEVVEDD